ncbi:MAG: hypothetical protein HYU39_02950 [Thaumarchaeota archaeon]|nr:hypothetical protein [Nitrososphaerota archaeon]
MALEIIWYIRFVEVLSLVVSSVLVALAYGGYKKSKSRALLSGALGFGMLGGASLLEGILFEAGGLSLEGAHAFRSTITAMGLVILLYSIHKTG